MVDRVIHRATDAVAGQGLSQQALKRLAFALLLGLIGVAAAWYGDHWRAVGRFLESTDDAYGGGAVTAIAPRVSRVIVAVAVTDHQAVHAGDLLVRRDDRDDRAAPARAAAAVAVQNARVVNLEATRRLRAAKVEEAEAGGARRDLVDIAR